ncbi:MAG: thiamine-phosphate kinase [Methylotenera sp.]|uniref:thiamine-phosphate kinase n=2 Tax=Methylotenera sp. TaxID=2051956 RepID=UPI002722DACD|nr:thiamine-phosphate kinase [Methylotenera sp.]MDO9392440.1 thiamine-phosphate kinase [Methylotenera sp.]
MSEFDLIHQYFTRPTRHTNLSVGDDAALISITKGMELAISADMLVAGTHFFADCDPYQLGWKSLAVNVSDMAAMGANPKWATLAIALPEVNQPWLTEFSNGFFSCADTFSIDLIGGDTTRGSLTISVQIMGEVPAGKAIKRSGAKVNDEIWVSGALGDAAMALAVMQQRFNLARSDLNQIENALHTPQPRVALGQALHGLANSAIDISDGLLADLGHILKASKLGAIIRLDQVPISDTVHKNLHLKQVKNMVLAGGDDYELCFTAPSNQHAEIANLSKTLNLALSHIGQITANTDLIVHGLDNEILDIKETGFDHFN